ncbi:MAG: hypothetical protein ACWM0S_05795 [Schaalia turicensis]
MNITLRRYYGAAVRRGMAARCGAPYAPWWYDDGAAALREYACGVGG